MNGMDIIQMARIRESGSCRRSCQAGISLVEVLAAVTIVIILTLLALIMAMQQIERTRAYTDETNVRMIAEGVVRYTINERRLPEHMQDLVARAYLQEIPDNPWGPGKVKDNQTDTYLLEVNKDAEQVVVKGILAEHTFVLDYLE